MAGTLTLDTLKTSSGVLSVQNGVTGIPKAWVKFNGLSGGTIATAFNVSSTTIVSTGLYQVNFTTAMPSSNYVVVSGVGTNTIITQTVSQSTTSYQFRTLNGVYALEGEPNAATAVFSN
jgi:hypothetical protein